MPNRDGTGSQNRSPRLFCQKWSVKNKFLKSKNSPFIASRAVKQLVSFMGVTIPIVFHLSKRLKQKPEVKIRVNQEIPEKLDRKENTPLQIIILEDDKKDE